MCQVEEFVAERAGTDRGKGSEWKLCSQYDCGEERR